MALLSISDFAWRDHVRITERTSAWDATCVYSALDTHAIDLEAAPLPRYKGALPGESDQPRTGDGLSPDEEIKDSYVLATGAPQWPAG